MLISRFLNLSGLCFGCQLSSCTELELEEKLQTSKPFFKNRYTALRAFRFPGLNSLNHQLIKCVFFVYKKLLT